MSDRRQQLEETRLLDAPEVECAPETRLCLVVAIASPRRAAAGALLRLLALSGGKQIALADEEIDLVHPVAGCLSRTTAVSTVNESAVSTAYQRTL